MNDGEDAPHWRKGSEAHVLAAIVIVAAVALVNAPIAAATYPERPIRLIVPSAPGGPTDIPARLLSQILPKLGQPVVVENRPGAGGNLASDVLAKSPPDGYTVLQTVNGIAISPSLYKVLPFDSQKDFIAVTQIVQSQLLLVANPKLDASNVAELIKLAEPHYDWIIVDSSPVLPVSDAVNLARSCDGVLLVARGGVTKFPVAQRAASELKASNILGFVLNAVQDQPQVGSYYGYDAATKD